jgi:hypothetical protein
MHFSLSLRCSTRLALAAACLIGLTGMNAVSSDDDGFVSLFDGKSLDGWQRYDGSTPGAQWVVEDGALHLKGGGGGDLATVEQYGDFILELEWKVAPGSNSGIIYRARPGDPAPYMSGPEYQILDDSRHNDGRNPKTSAASFYALVAPEGKRLKPVGEWNTARLVVQGTKVEHWVNGQKVVELDISSDEFKSMVAKSKFKAWPQFAQSAKGHIVLQDHGDPVWYRNIRIKPL